MNLKQLHYFIEFSEDLSFTSAAKRLFITQQGLSKAILELEKELDCLLIVRSTKGLSLTEAGKQLLLHANNIINEYTQMRIHMQEYSEHPTIHINIAIGARFLLSKDILESFSLKYPHISVKINELNNADCLQSIADGTADIAIAIPSASKRCYKCISLWDENIVLLVPANNLLAGRTNISLADLNGLPLVIRSDSDSHSFLECCENAGVRPNIIEEVPDIISVYQYCEQYHLFGISLEHLKGKICFPGIVEKTIDSDEVIWKLSLITAQNHSNNYGVQLFTKHLLNEIYK